jgi:CheY-like chemotaxis protein
MPGGGELRIVTENRSITGAALGQPSHFVVLSVSDTGTGIDPAVQERMFEPYFTTKASRGGTGVGLATVRNIALLHAGHVEVSTAPGQGTTFRVVLPRAPLAASSPVIPLALESSASPAARVLLVEAEPANRSFLAKCLREEGHQVSVVENGAEALGWVQTSGSPVDVLITDLFLPDISGLDVATRFRERWPGLGVVFLSDGHGISDEAADDIPLVIKPFTAPDLSRAMRRAMAVRPGR